MRHLLTLPGLKVAYVVCADVHEQMFLRPFSQHAVLGRWTENFDDAAFFPRHAIAVAVAHWAIVQESESPDLLTSDDVEVGFKASIYVEEAV